MKKRFSLLVIFSLIISLVLSFSCCPKCDQKTEMSASLRAPIGWGCPEINANMTITFLNCDKTFNGRISASNLLHDHDYSMCINGKTDHKSNDILKKNFNTTSDGKEGYSDFHSFRTDSLGNYSGNFSKNLPCGNYEVQIFVKDNAKQHCIVLMNQSDFTFTIEK